MAEPLSIAASIAGLVSLAGSVFGALCELSHQLKDFKREIKELQTVTKELSVLLHELSLLATALETESAFDSSFRLEHVDSCERTLHEIKTKLDKITPSQASSTGTRNAIKSTIDRLKWPYSSKEFEKMLADLSRHKETISLALSADSMKALLEFLSRQRHISDGIDDIQNNIKEIKTRIFVDEHRQKVLDFFLPVNPQPNLEMSLRLRHPMTGLWLTEGQVFKNWISSQNAKLWMSGIPGAGKTVLAGSVIEDVLRQTATRKDDGACFFFCDYKDEKSLSVINILSSFSSQLARQNDSAYGILESYYAELHSRNELPKAIELTNLQVVLAKICKEFQRVLIVVDGLDECGSESPLAEILSDLAHSSNTVSMALLSRDEFHLQEALHQGFNHIDIAANDNDVRRYVREELEQRIKCKKLRLRNLALKEDIINTLIKNADGMFRWVSCQLDYLCELPLDRDRREALTKLPPTLYATYERILSRHTHPSAVHITSTTLSLVASVGAQITIPALCEAVAAPEDNATCLDKDDVVLEEDILTYCSSLLRKSTDNQRFEFAHFSVLEYLKSGSLQGPELEVYHIGKDDTVRVISLSLRFLLLDDFDLGLSSSTSVDEALDATRRVCESHPFYQFASWKWPHLNDKLLRVDEDQCQYAPAFHDAARKARELFSARGQTQFKTWAITYCRQLETLVNTRKGGRLRKNIPDILSGRFSPTHLACALNFPLLAAKLVDGRKEGLLVNHPMSPFSCLLFGLEAFFQNKGFMWHNISDSLRVLDTTGLEVWVEGIALLIQRGFKLPRTVHLFWKQMGIMKFILGKLEVMLELTYEPVDPTKMFLRLSRAGLRTEPDALESLLKVTRLYHSRLDLGKQGSLENQFLLIEQELQRTGHSPGILLEMNRITTRTSCTLPPGGQGVDYLQIENMSNLVYEQYVRQSVEVGNVPQLQLLESDKRYAFVEKGGYSKEPLLQLAARKMSGEAFQYLCRTNGADLFRNGDGGSMWHELELVEDIWFFEILKSSCADPQASQEEVNHDGETPFRYAVKIGQYPLARRLFPLCRTSKCWSGQPSIYTMALEGGIGAVDFVRDMAAAKVLIDEGSLPVHNVRPDSSPIVLERLIEIWPDCLEERCRGRLPIERILERLPTYEGDSLDGRLVSSLLPQCDLLKLEAFCFLCSNVISSKRVSPESAPYFPRLLLVVLESFAHLPGLCLRLYIDELFSHVGNIKCNTNYGSGHAKSHWEEMSALDSITHRILASNIDSVETEKRSQLLHQLLRIAVYLNWVEVCHACLALEPNLHEKGGNRSALEVACLPGSLCSNAIFTVLLDAASKAELHDISLLLFSLVDDDEKMLILLSHGADANVRHPVSGQPAVIYHMLRHSAVTSQMLLKHGAHFTTESQIDYICGLVWYDYVDELKAFGTQHPDLLREKTFCIPEFLHPEMGFLKADREPGDIAGCNLLHLAASRGSLNCMRYLIEEEVIANVNAPTVEGYTCAHLLAMKGPENLPLIAKYLIDRGADMNALTLQMSSPLDVAIEFSLSRDLTMCLLDIGARGSKLGCCESWNPRGACDILEYIMIDFDGIAYPDDPSLTKACLYVLAKALELGDVPTCARLKALGCPLDTAFPNCGACSPLLHALKYFDPDVAEWLLDNGGATWGTGCEEVGAGENPISLAIKRVGWNPILQRLIYCFRSRWPQWLLNGPPVISRAIAAWNTHALELILHFISSKGRSADFAVVQTPGSMYRHATVEPDDEFMSAMPSVADILNTPGEDMALHEAARQGNILVMKTLLDYGVDINARDASERTAAYFAALENKNEALSFLLAKGASPISPFPDCPSLLHIAAENDNIEQLQLISPYCGCLKVPQVQTGYNSPVAFCSSVNCLDYLFAEGFEAGGLDDLGVSTFHVLLGKKEIQEYLLRSDLFRQSGLCGQCIPLAYLYWETVKGIVEFIPRLLDTLGKDAILAMFPSRPCSSYSALFYAACYGLLDSCRALLSIGADLEFDNDDHGTSLAVAIREGRLDVVKFLIRAGAKMVYYHRKSSTWQNASYYAHLYPEIWHWLLVGRYTELRSITLPVYDESD